MTLINRLTAAFAVVLFAMLAVAPLPAEGQGSVELDRAALEAIYHAMNGPGWVQGRGSSRPVDDWLTDRPLGTWHGVQVRTDSSSDNRLYSGVEMGRVVGLWLDHKNLSGSIPPEIGDLLELRSINMAGNSNLSGPIPPEINRLSNLRSVTITHTNLSGPLPDFGAGFRRYNTNSGGEEIPSTIWLNDNNNLSGPIPPSFGQMRNVELWIYESNLTGSIPPELGNARHVGFRFNSNNLTGRIPRALINLEEEERRDVRRGGYFAASSSSPQGALD